MKKIAIYRNNSVKFIKKEILSTNKNLSVTDFKMNK